MQPSLNASLAKGSTLPLGTTLAERLARMRYLLVVAAVVVDEAAAATAAPVAVVAVLVPPSALALLLRVACACACNLALVSQPVSCLEGTIRKVSKVAKSFKRNRRCVHFCFEASQLLMPTAFGAIESKHHCQLVLNH